MSLQGIQEWMQRHPENVARGRMEIARDVYHSADSLCEEVAHTEAIEATEEDDEIVLKAVGDLLMDILDFCNAIGLSAERAASDAHDRMIEHQRTLAKLREANSRIERDDVDA